MSDKEGLGMSGKEPSGFTPSIWPLTHKERNCKSQSNLLYAQLAELPHLCRYDIHLHCLLNYHQQGAQDLSKIIRRQT